MGPRVVHYINQFFAGIGGEVKADLPPQVRAGPIGPGRLLHTLLDGRGLVVATLICGDTYFAEQQEEALSRLADLLLPLEADLLLAGPAFASGRYGLACGEVARLAVERFGIAAAAAMHPDNPGAQAAATGVYIVPCGASALSMRESLPPLVALGMKLASGAQLSPEVDGYLPRGIRRNVVAERPAAVRAIDMLLAKIHGRPFASEIPLPNFDRVAPTAPLPDVRQAVVALVTEGGLVPAGNPDRIESSRARRYARYPIGPIRAFEPGEFESVHGGYATDHVNSDPNRLLPLDAARRLEAAGQIGRIHDLFYTTVGNGTSVQRAQAFGQEIAAELLASGVQAAILTAT